MKKTTKKRLEDIYNYILANENAKTNELAKLMDVSPEMIRKDLAILESQGSIIRVHGGAIVRPENEVATFLARVYKCKSIKDEICHRALKYVNDGDIVFIDASSTALQLSRLLKTKNNITIITNCIETMKLASNTGHKVIILGGEYSKTGDRTIGVFASEILKRFVIDVSFIGTDGCLKMDGPGTYTEYDIPIMEEVIHRSKKNVLMMDSTKFSKSAPYTYASFSDFDVLITDKMDESRKDILIPIIDEIKDLR